MAYAYRVIWNSKRIDLSTAPEKLSTAARAIFLRVFTLYATLLFFPYF